MDEKAICECCKVETAQNDLRLREVGFSRLLVCSDCAAEVDEENRKFREANEEAMNELRSQSSRSKNEEFYGKD